MLEYENTFFITILSAGHVFTWTFGPVFIADGTSRHFCCKAYAYGKIPLVLYLCYRIVVPYICLKHNRTGGVFWKLYASTNQLFCCFPVFPVKVIRFLYPAYRIPVIVVIEQHRLLVRLDETVYTVSHGQRSIDTVIYLYVRMRCHYPDAFTFGINKLVALDEHGVEFYRLWQSMISHCYHSQYADFADLSCCPFPVYSSVPVLRILLTVSSL